MTSSAAASNVKETIIHVFVIGFHHKKGCVVEFSYPPILEGDNLSSSELPDPWKHLPTLALPDGAHNYEEDTIYFHLPSLENPRQTVYGISCYRQMNAQHLLRRSSDITRETVQKSVCVLSRLPLFGLIQAKLELITHAYFDERDFSKVSLLEETYNNLNSSLPKDLLDGQQAFLGLSVRDFVLRFKHKTLLLFKLLLLEKKVLFYKAPVKNLCSTVLTLCSLVPGMIEKGLGEAATSVITRTSPELRISAANQDSCGENNNEICDDSLCSANNALQINLNENQSDISWKTDFSSIDSNTNNNFIATVEESSVQDCTKETNSTVAEKENITGCKLGDDIAQHFQNKKFIDVDVNGKRLSQSSSDTDGESWVKVNQVTPDLGSSATSVTSSTDTEPKVNTTVMNNEDKLLHEIDAMLDLEDKTKNLTNSSLEFQDDSIIMCNSKDMPLKNNDYLIKDNCYGVLPPLRGSKSVVLPSATSIRMVDNLDIRRWSESLTQSPMKEDNLGVTNSQNVMDIESDECGLPLAVFTKGMLCHPYLSLPFLDLLSDVTVRGFLVGATNILFKQKKQLFDVIVEVDDGKVDIVDSELRKQLNLTTEDLRFADHLVRHVMEDKKDVFLDGTGWEGGDEWLRSQFKLYLLSVMRTSQIEVSGKENEAFNNSFVSAWKATHNYKMWRSRNYGGVLEVNPGHPFHGQLSMADMKLKFSHTMQSTERGRRLNSAVTSTGKAVLQTGKAVGGALTSAKSVVSSWWSNFGVPPQPEKGEENSLEWEEIEEKLEAYEISDREVAQ